jgi:hypothetical protein
MPCEFLHHLTHAKLPVAIYDHCLVKQLQAYEDQALVVTVALKLGGHAAMHGTDIVPVTKITSAGQRTVRCYLQGQKTVKANA